MEKVQFGCLMLEYPANNWDKLLSQIDDDDLYDDGSGTFLKETEPHVTVLYGFHDEVKSGDIRKLIDDLRHLPIKAKLTSITFFDCPDYDVVKFDVDCPELHILNAAVRELPHTNSYPDYHPHVTLAYVKKGAGEKYKDITMEPVDVIFEKFIYSDKDRNKEYWTLGKIIPTFDQFFRES